jgi:hypothetical protein
MEKQESFFLLRLFRIDKVLFAAVCLYITGVLYHALKQREEFPFFLYGMYSLKVPPQPNYYTYSITIGGQEIKYAKLRDAQKELIESSLEHAVPMMQAGTLSKDDELKFKRWLMNYCLDMRMPGDNTMNVYRLSCSYNAAGQIAVDKRELIYTYAGEPTF